VVFLSPFNFIKLRSHPTESLLHAQQSGEILTGLDGHPSLKIASIEESHKHSIYDILAESSSHETAALNLYKESLSIVEGCSVYLEEYARGMIGQEELHGMELRKMLRDFTPQAA